MFKKLRQKGVEPFCQVWLSLLQSLLAAPSCLVASLGAGERCQQHDLEEGDQPGVELILYTEVFVKVRSMDVECPFVTFIPVELELSKGVVGDSRRSFAEVPKLNIAGAVPVAARAPSVLSGLSPGVGGAWRTCSDEGSGGGAGCLVSGGAVLSVATFS